jgi:hypothetical protein
MECNSAVVLAGFFTVCMLGQTLCFIDEDEGIFVK